MNCEVTVREWLIHNFYLVYAAVPLVLGYLLLKKFNDSASSSQFRRGNSDLPPTYIQLKNSAARAKSQEPAKPLQLAGFRTDAPPHEILGVTPHASVAEIQRAYKEMMKRFHPDRVGAPGSQAWQDAQPIAEAINRARDLMLKR
ncbi:MAG: J domain-containing protein [Proteobacteria bacterium]|nr:MAG: J domain-containing protein [Pseudomonadota bacterium]